MLVGEEGARDTLLSSPIILEDYPRIAPESPGDLFDGGEIDQLLILNILSLTDEEKAEARASDPRVRELLERSEALHARAADAPARRRSASCRCGDEPAGTHSTAARRARSRSAACTSAAAASCALRRREGARRGDVFDHALAGKPAVVESIQQDIEGDVQLAVVLEEDPGRDLGVARQPGHRFFFSAGEVEPLPGPAMRPGAPQRPRRRDRQRLPRRRRLRRRGRAAARRSASCPAA